MYLLCIANLNAWLVAENFRTDIQKITGHFSCPPLPPILSVTKKLIFHSQYNLKVILHLSLSEFVYIWLSLNEARNTSVISQKWHRVMLYVVNKQYWLLKKKIWSFVYSYNIYSLFRKWSCSLKKAVICILGNTEE